MTHSPHPWTLSNDDHPDVIDANGDAIAEILCPPDGPLIASAPKLLAALKAMVAAYWTGSEDCEPGDEPSMVKDALAAIVEAEGQI